MALIKLFVTFLRFGLGLLLVCCLITMVGLAAAHAVPYEGDLAYIATPKGYNQLFLMDVERGFNFPLDKDDIYLNDCCLTWAPGGNAIAFVRDVSSDGSTDIFSLNFHDPPQRLTTLQGADLYPTYSPDGRQIAYISYGFGNPQIVLMNADASGNHVLTGNKRITNLSPFPVWSANGHSILFSDFNSPGSLLTVPSDCTNGCEAAIRPAFQMNGMPLMTTSFLALDPSHLFMAAFDRVDKTGYGVYSFDTQSTTKPERLTTNFGLASPAMVVYDHWLAFVSGNTNPKQSVSETNLYVLDTDCIGSEKGCMGTLQEVAHQIRADDSVSWSNDGHWLAYITDENNISRLNLLDTTCIMEHRDCTDYIHRLPVTSIRYIRPMWRPVIR